MSRAAATVVIAAFVALSALQAICEGACVEHADATPSCHARQGADSPKLGIAPHDCADHSLASAVSPPGGRFATSPIALAVEPIPPAIRVFAHTPSSGAGDGGPPIASLRVPLRI